MKKLRSRLPRLVWRRGAHLEGTLLWFDAPRRHALSFVSHAHVASVPGARLLCTSATATLLGHRGAVLTCEYGQPLSLGPLRIELFPSGHMLGGAQIAVDTPDGRLVFTGPLLRTGTTTSPPAAVKRCDVLALDCGPVPLPALPPRAEALEALRQAIAEAHQRDQLPVLLAETPGPAQDVLRALPALPVRAPARLIRHCRAYASLGVALPEVRLFRGRLGPGELLLWPPDAGSARALIRSGRVRWLSALEGGCASRPDRLPIDRTVPIAWRSERAELEQYIADTGARKVYLLGRRTADLARSLRAAGLEAQPLGPPRQMSLGL